MVPPNCLFSSEGHRQKGHGVVYHLQQEHHQSYLKHHFQNASIQGRQIQCNKDQMQVSYKETNMVDMIEQSRTKVFQWVLDRDLRRDHDPDHVHHSVHDLLCQDHGLGHVMIVRLIEISLVHTKLDSL